MVQTVWLDCDPGHDDFFAIIMALFHPNSKLIGISTVGGNQTLEKVTINALNALNIFNRGDIPVVCGQEHSLLSANVACPEIHGETGLETSNKDFVWPQHDLKPVPGKAIEVMAKAILSSPEPVHLVATGRLTNIALLLTVYPEVTQNLVQISIMGGSHREGGNTGILSEFNIDTDPESAQIVFNHGCTPELVSQYRTTQQYNNKTEYKVPIALIPLDITHKVLVTDDVVQRIKDSCPISETPNYNNTNINECDPKKPSIFAQTCLDLLHFFATSYREYFGFKYGPPLHDPAALYYALMYPLECKNDGSSPFVTKHLRMDIQMGQGPARGATVADMFGLTGKPKNVILCLELDIEHFWNDFMLMMNAANKACIL